MNPWAEWLAFGLFLAAVSVGVGGIYYLAALGLVDGVREWLRGFLRL